MFNVIQFILRFGTFFLFLALEIISIFLIVNYNKAQQEIFLNSANIFSGTVNEKFNRVKNFVNQYTVADSISLENAVLYQERFNYPFLFDTLDQFKVTSLNFSVIPARVINNSVSSQHNYFTINKGADDGIYKGLGVMCRHGVVGIVKSTSKHFSLIISILNKDIKTSASIRRNGYFGSLAWEGTDPQILNLEDLPRHAEVKLGDTIQTSGYSLIFPKGILLGTVKKIMQKEGTNFYSLPCKIWADISKLDIVYVLKNNAKPELEKLETNAGSDK
ncbi:MAG: rod shape-determining protein MreC [Saprospiraceae bacterium]|nr:rod shape-determining protein MreC [Saprospiraceae bacterium]